MSDYTLTPVLGLYKPTPGLDGDQWGEHLNANADVLDTALAPLAGGPFLPLAGGTLTGSLTASRYIVIAGGASGPSQLFFDAAAGGQRMLAGRSAGATRWTLMPGDMTAESGANAGANFAIARYSDAGGYIDTPLTISRASGITTFAAPVMLPGDPTVALGAATKAYADTRMPLAGGTMTGPLILSGDPATALGAVTKQYSDGKLSLTGGTVAGNVTINGVVAINSLMRDPVTETINNTTFTTLTLTANNAQDSLNHVFRMHTDTNGFVSTSGHSPAVYGETSAIDTVPGGTLTWATGVMGVSGNNGIGTVVNACDFMGHPTINSVAGGTVTNHYILFGPSSLPGKATNEYGFSMPAPSGIGTTTPVAWLEIRVADNLSTTRIARFRNNTGPIIDITADSIVALTGSLGIGTTTPAGLLEVRGATALSTDRLLRVRNNAGSVLDIMANQSIGLFGVAPATRQTVSGAWAGNTAGKALCVALAAYGLIIDGTTA